MKIAIMQPYFFPYIGYWQLINAVDIFIIYDDVNFIKKGWINRNNILFNKQKKMFTLPLVKMSQNKLINETFIAQDSKPAVLDLIKSAYAKAPYFNEVFPILSDIILYEENNLTKYLSNSLQKISNYVGINTKFLYSSKIDKDNSLHGEDKIIEICKKIRTQTYINPIGGHSLYNKDDFAAENISLKFIQPKDIIYKQFNNDFVPSLSIIDIIMFNPPEKIKEMLNDYGLT